VGFIFESEDFLLYTSVVYIVPGVFISERNPTGDYIIIIIIIIIIRGVKKPE